LPLDTIACRVNMNYHYSNNKVPKCNEMGAFGGLNSWGIFTYHNYYDWSRPSDLW